MIHLDIFKEIFHNLKLKYQIRLLQINKYHNHYLQIIDFYHMNNKYLNALTDEIIINYPNLQKLNIKYNPKCTKNVMYLTNLSELNCSSVRSKPCNLAEEQIKYLNLTKLKMQGNVNIENLNHLTNLRTLNCNFSIITDDSIKNLDLMKLSVKGNFKIKNISAMTNLKSLNCGWFSHITEDGIKNLKLTKLDIVDNVNIKNLNHLTSIKSLKCGQFHSTSDLSNSSLT